jgi:hypothetical protein
MTTLKIADSASKRAAAREALSDCEAAALRLARSTNQLKPYDTVSAAVCAESAINVNAPVENPAANCRTNSNKDVTTKAASQPKAPSPLTLVPLGLALLVVAVEFGMSTFSTLSLDAFAEEDQKAKPSRESVIVATMTQHGSNSSAMMSSSGDPSSAKLTCRCFAAA